MKKLVLWAKVLILTIAAIPAIQLASVSASPVHDTQYTWVYDSREIGVARNGGLIVSQHLPDSTTMVVDRIYGKWHYDANFAHCFGEPDGNADCTGYPAICDGSYCAGGRFIYTRNTELNPLHGDGLNFSSTAIAEFDPTPITEFTMSSPVFFASLAGFLDTDIVKMGIISLFVIWLSAKFIPQLLDMLYSVNTPEEDKRVAERKTNKHTAGKPITDSADSGHE